MKRIETPKEMVERLKLPVAPTRSSVDREMACDHGYFDGISPFQQEPFAPWDPYYMSGWNEARNGRNSQKGRVDEQTDRIHGEISQIQKYLNELEETQAQFRRNNMTSEFANENHSSCEWCNNGKLYDPISGQYEKPCKCSGGSR